MIYFSTVTGNANFRMAQTSFTMLGFTQPQTALPIIEDAQNNAKGFTSRILWFFPEPVFCKMAETRLTPVEKKTARSFNHALGNNPLISSLLYKHSTNLKSKHNRRTTHFNST